MALLRLEPFPNFSKTLEKNKWADFVELLCLESPDKEYSLNDIITLYSQEELSGISNGDEDHSEKVDKLRAQFAEIFFYIFSRMDYINDYYPFKKIDEDTIKLDVLDEKKMLYMFLLFSSNTSYITDNTIPPYFTKAFERISIDIMKMIYPNFINEIFGTSVKKGEFFYGGSLIDKLLKLAQCFNTSLQEKAKVNPRFLFPSGDAGIDLISYFKPDMEKCNTYMIPLCVGQCSCSYEKWNEKQYLIMKRSLDNLFIDLSDYNEYMFLPFPLRGINGKWASEEAVKIQTIIIDRIRFLNIIHKNGKATILDNEVTNYMKVMLRNFDVEC